MSLMLTSGEPDSVHRCGRARRCPLTGTPGYSGNPHRRPLLAEFSYEQPRRCEIEGVTPMTETQIRVDHDPWPGQTLVRSLGGALLHLPACPHVRGGEVRPATTAERASTPACAWSRAELDGTGRRAFPGLEEAMRWFGTHVDDQVRVRALLRGVEHDELWVPNSRCYIALGRNGLAVAWVHSGFVRFPGGLMELLPSHLPGGGGGSPDQRRHGATCPGCGIEMPLAGGCGWCGR